jgi:hypothetical protein
MCGGQCTAAVCICTSGPCSRKSSPWPSGVVIDDLFGFRFRLLCCGNTHCLHCLNLGPCQPDKWPGSSPKRRSPTFLPGMPDGLKGVRACARSLPPPPALSMLRWPLSLAPIHEDEVAAAAQAPVQVLRSWKAVFVSIC